jgi:DNA repair/transcription protein MET18/MMS19
MADISEDRTNLINIVKALGEYLTAEESDVLQKGRSRNATNCYLSVLIIAGVEFLSLVVARCPKEKLNRQSGIS